MNNPLVSVALRAYNQSKQILKALESVIMQDVDFPVEIVCGVDLSTDDTLEVVRQFATSMPANFSLRLLAHPANVGGGQNLKAILTQCQGKYIAWLDGDDYWIDPLKTKKQVEILEQNDEIGVVYTDDYIDSPYTNGLQERSRSTLTHDAFSQLLLGNYITSETAIFRKSLLDYIDWDEFIKYPADDWFIWIECSAHSQFFHLQEYTAAATIYRTIDEHITLAALEYTERNLPLQKYYISKYSHLTHLTEQSIIDDFAQSVIRAGIILKDSSLTAKGTRLHSTPVKIKNRLYYAILSHKLTFNMYMLYRKLKGKDNLTPMQRYFY